MKPGMIDPADPRGFTPLAVLFLVLAIAWGLVAWLFPTFTLYYFAIASGILTSYLIGFNINKAIRQFLHDRREREERLREKIRAELAEHGVDLHE